MHGSWIKNFIVCMLVWTLAVGRAAEPPKDPQTEAEQEAKELAKELDDLDNSITAWIGTTALVLANASAGAALLAVPSGWREFNKDFQTFQEKNEQHRKTLSDLKDRVKGIKYNIKVRATLQKQYSTLLQQINDLDVSLVENSRFMQKKI